MPSPPLLPQPQRTVIRLACGKCWRAKVATAAEAARIRSSEGTPKRSVVSRSQACISAAERTCMATMLAHEGGEAKGVPPPVFWEQNLYFLCVAGRVAPQNPESNQVTRRILTDKELREPLPDFDWLETGDCFYCARRMEIICKSVLTSLKAGSVVWQPDLG